MYACLVDSLNHGILCLLDSQIRLMISGAVMTTRGQLPDYFLRLALNWPAHFPLPLAPAEGLVLTNAAFLRNSPQISMSYEARELDLAMSRFTDVESYISNEHAPCYTLLTDEEYKNSERFLNTAIYPLMIKDWVSKEVLDQRIIRELRQSEDATKSETERIVEIAKTLQIDSSAISRSLEQHYVREMSKFKVSAATRAVWDQLISEEIPKVQEQRRSEKREKDIARQRFMRSELRGDLNALIRRLLSQKQAKSQKPMKPVDIDAEISFLLQPSKLTKLNELLRYSLGSDEMRKIRRTYPHRLLLPSTLSSALTTRYQLYPGHSLHGILRVLATRSFYHSLTEDQNSAGATPEGPWDSLDGIFRILEEEMTVLEAGITSATKDTIPDGVAQVTWQALQERQRLLRWYTEYAQASVAHANSLWLID